MTLDVRQASAHVRPLVAPGTSAEHLVVRPTDWMGALDASLSLADLTIPGSHNAGATRGGRYVVCQQASIAQQLAMGVRYLDIRVRVRRGGLGIYHGSTHQGIDLRDVLSQCDDFLRAHPTECIVVCISQERCNVPTSVLAPRWLEVKREFAHLLADSRRVPALGRARGRVVVVTREHAIGGIDQRGWVVQDDWHVPDARAWQARKWPAVTDQLRRARAARGDGRMWSCSGSSNGWALPPAAAAKLAHRALTSHFAELNDTPGERNGIVLVDFAEPEIAGLLAGRNLGRSLA